MKPAGLRRHYLEIQYDAGAASGTQNADGHTTEDWQKRCNAWGSIETAAGATSTEKWNAYHMDANVSHVVTIPYTTGLRAEDRIKFGTRIFQFSGPPINPDERNFELIIPVMESPTYGTG